MLSSPWSTNKQHGVNGPLFNIWIRVALAHVWMCRLLSASATAAGTAENATYRYTSPINTTVTGLTSSLGVVDGPRTPIAARGERFVEVSDNEERYRSDTTDGQLSPAVKIDRVTTGDPHPDADSATRSKISVRMPENSTPSSSSFHPLSSSSSSSSPSPSSIPLAVGLRDKQVPRRARDKSEDVHYIVRPIKERIKLYVGGLFELSRDGSSYSSNGGSDLAAAHLAVTHVNQQDFVPGYELELLPNDTKCDPGSGADAFYDFIYRKPQLVMLIGTACSEVTETLGEIVPYWNLLLVSHAATSPALSKREKFPTFFRLAAADSSHNSARKTFIQHFGWSIVATLQEDIETFSLAMNDMNKGFEKDNIKVKATLTFRSIGDDLRAQLRLLQESEARIIIGSFREEAARHVFCEAYRLGMYGHKYVWMLLGWYTDRWWTLGNNDVNCTHAQLAEATQGYYTVNSLSSIIGSHKSITGLTTQDFLHEYDKLGVTSQRSAFAKLTYDSVLTVALTLRKAMDQWKASNTSRDRLDRFTYHDGASMRKTFSDVMGGLDFMGVSGPVSFDGPDRRGVTVLEQNQDGKQQRIALFYPENDTLDWFCEGCRPIVWTGGRVPADRYVILLRLEHIDSEAFIIVCAVSCFGIFLASFFLAFNLYNRNYKYIKLSSPKLNDVTVVGCILVYLAVILLGLDENTTDLAYFSHVCMGRSFLLVAGFSLAFGAMFTKTYRVHQIFRGCNNGLVKNKLLKDTHLLAMIGALLALDTGIMSLWILIDPMQRRLTNYTVEHSEEDDNLMYIPQMSKCHSENMTKFLGTLYTYKGLLLLFGVYMAWETRGVKIPALNDSQYIGMSIYNVVLCSITVVALSNLISDKPTLSYSLVSALIMLSTTVMLGLLFLPKIYAIAKHRGNPVIATSGLTVAANTRRFVIDDQKELHSRTEIQNRVYKRELVELQRKIKRLQRLLDASSTSSYAELSVDVTQMMSTSASPSLPERELSSPPRHLREKV